MSFKVTKGTSPTTLKVHLLEGVHIKLIIISKPFITNFICFRNG